MEICEVGNNFKIAKRIAYNSDRTFMDFDAIVLDFQSIFFDHYQLYGSLFEKRKTNLLEFLQHKNVPLIIFTPLPRNVSLSNYTIDSILPVKPFSVVKETGHKFNILPNTKFTDFFKKYEEYFFYNSYFDNYEGTVIAETPFTKKVLAFYNETSIFLPELKTSIDKVEAEFLTELFVIVKQINFIGDKVSLPDWANKYFLLTEKPLLKDIFETKRKISDLQNMVEKKELQLSEIKNKKILFTGTGNNLEGEIENVFRQLGVEILEVGRNRDDLIIKYKEKVAVVEVKGVNGTSAEKHASQLEKWVNIYYENKEVLPKGILIVNTFKEQELDQRNGESFPHQMLEFSEMRKHCLITGLQFLGLYYTAIAENKTEKLIDSLFSTIGIYKGFEDWKNFIEE